MPPLRPHLYLAEILYPPIGVHERRVPRDSLRVHINRMRAPRRLLRGGHHAQEPGLLLGRARALLRHLVEPLWPCGCNG